MNIKEAMRTAGSCVKPVTASIVLANEVKRLQEQRRQLASEIPFFRKLQRKTLDILDEIDFIKQEEEKMTVDEATSYLSRYYPTVTATLANEIKRLREDTKKKDEEIKRFREKIQTLDIGFHRIHEFTDPEHRSATADI